MKKHYQILIVGGGNAGLSLAAQLLRKQSNLQIGIIEPSEKHYYQPAWTLVGAGAFDIKATEKNEADFIPKGSTWIKDAAVAFEPDKNQLTCASGSIFSYDVLFVAIGIGLDWHKIEGLKETIGKNQVSSNYDFNAAPYTWEMIRNFKGGVAVFTNPSTPIKCGGAPHKIMYLACDYWRKKGILDKCDVHYLSGASVIFGVPEYAQTLRDVVAKNNIKVHFGVNVNKIDSNNKTVFYEEKDANGNFQLKQMNFDLCHAVPPQSALPIIKNSPLADANNPYGYIEVDKHTFQHIRYKNIFSCGDTSNAPCSKTGAAIRKQIPVVVEHILAHINKTTSTASYDGYSACPIPTQYGKLMLAEFDYSNKPKMTFPFDQAKPRWTMWILKTKILPWLYWNRILTGKA